MCRNRCTERIAASSTSSRERATAACPYYTSSQNIRNDIENAINNIIISHYVYIYQVFAYAGVRICELYSSSVKDCVPERRDMFAFSARATSVWY